jgi:isoleucyl-tRNA synthetase
VQEATDAYDAFLAFRVTDAYERFVDDVSNWYIRRSRRRFWDGDELAFSVLWFALVQALRVASPVMPFLTEHLWRVLVPDGPASVFLAGWPESREPDRKVLEGIAELREIVELGRQARGEAGLKLRQPLRGVEVFGAVHAQGHEDEIKDELRVEEVTFSEAPLTRFRYKPNLRVLGPRLGRDLKAVQDALARDEFELLGDNNTIRVAGHELSAADDLIPEVASKQGLARSERLAVQIDPELDDEMLLKGRVLDLIHRVNTMRKEAGLELTDRITLTLPQSEKDLLAHEDLIKNEVLATQIETDSGSDPQIAKV